jgi:hypothetical protein
MQKAKPKLEEAAELVAGTELKDELSELWQEAMHEYMQEKDEDEDEFEEEQITTPSEKDDKTKQRVRAPIAMRSRLRHHISRDGYYSLSALCSELPRYHETTAEQEKLRVKVEDRFGITPTGTHQVRR